MLFEAGESLPNPVLLRARARGVDTDVIKADTVSADVE
jgi:hypothetical protein